MEIRRVQITGGASYAITLPKDWIKLNKINKNDQLGLFSKPDGTLLITPKMISKKPSKTKEFTIDKDINQKYLLRQLLGAYITGYNSIKINSKKRMPSEVGSTVRNFTQITIGQEVVEETDETITIKDLLRPAEMPFNSTIKRMHLIVKSMHEDAMKALETGNKKIVEEILLRDSDIDRLHWLVARQCNILLQDISLSEKMSIPLSMTYTYFQLSRIIERMGDHVVSIAKNILKLADSKLDKKIKENIQFSSDLALDIFNKSIGSFFQKDIKTSNRNIEIVQKLEVLCREINSMAIRYDGSIAISIGHIAESIRRIGEYAEDISETTINYLVGLEKN
ncbi:MAG: PhoU family transcriptional regulator [Thermoplasmata archaeon M9B1D]|nr:MAG: PhoU family transcriptional regulator [Thermoplasmata archaeon M9B1D]PNX50130.1 MAG: PhoU family transcriptional regulator [Thermoplasmata archaeon M8B2D]